MAVGSWIAKYGSRGFTPRNPHKTASIATSLDKSRWDQKGDFGGTVVWKSSHCCRPSSCPASNRKHRGWTISIRGVVGEKYLCWWYQVCISRASEATACPCTKPCMP